MPVTTTNLSFRFAALVVAAGTALAACTTVDIGGPRANKNNPQAGILQLESGKRIAVLPAEFNYTGSGSYTWPDGRQQAGSWLNGRLQGMGSETTSTQNYTGQWHDGQRQGHGELNTTTTGSHYVGDFVSGLPQGKGTETSESGVYRGTWQAGRRDGQGQFNGSDGAQYQGQWRNGMRDGYGHEKYADSSVYEGDWQEDQPHGFGRRFYTSGATFEGRWESGARQGYGLWVSPADVHYEGTWNADEQHGFGKETRPDGSFFAGEWRAGRRHGIGREVHADGSVHAGYWQDDTISGPGSRTNRAGIVISGNWEQNAIVEGSLTLPGPATYEGALFSPDGNKVAPALLRWLTDSARAQNIHAQYFLATMYLDFADPAADPNTAEVWLQRAALAGLAEAEFRLSVLLLSQDAQTSIGWLQRAAAQQHPTANQILGEYFHTGQHFEQDFSAAIKHYEIASAQGSVAATNNLAWLLATVSDDEIANPQRAIDLIRPFVLYLGNWQHLDTLAAAHARIGDTALAQRMQNQALILAKSLATDRVIAEMAARLELYANDQAYIE